MKILLIFGLVVLAGCVANPTMEELEAEAMQTGDWSKVEQRELLQARRMGRARTQCPTDFALFCDTDSGEEDCRCVNREAYRAMYNKGPNVQPPNPAKIGENR